jgi:2-haloacid dehalogenase
MSPSACGCDSINVGSNAARSASSIKRKRVRYVSASSIGGLDGIVFDAYGTLFDVAALESACAAVTSAPAPLSQLWRAKQLEYSFIRTVIDRYADWGQLTSDALDYASTALGVAIGPGARRALMDAWLTLPAFPDVLPALTRMHDAGLRLAILSNGAREMLLPLVRHNELEPLLFALLTSERVQTFKPDPAIYSLAPDRFRAHIYELLFVTANGFDVAGSKSYGFTVCRVSRAGLPLDALGYEPDMTVTNLTELADILLGDSRQQLNAKG